MNEQKEREQFITRDEFLGCIVPELVNAKANEKDLADMPHRPFFSEMAIRYVHCYKTFPGGVDLRLRITNGIAQAMEITEEELYEAAIRNAEYSYGILTMEDAGFICSGYMMACITSEAPRLGSAGILQEGIRREVAQMLGGDFVVIPSSVDEVICFPVEPGIDMNNIKDFIRTANRDSDIVKKEHVLADTPLLCNAQTLELTEVEA